MENKISILTSDGIRPLDLNKLADESWWKLWRK